MEWKGKVYKLVQVGGYYESNGELDHSCAGCAFEHEDLFDPDSGCESAGDGCIAPDASFIWQEEQSQ